jgi:branched-chain amino acid aminotransferase
MQEHARNQESLQREEPDLSAYRAETERPGAAFPLCFHKGAFVPWDSATLHVGSLALRYALSVFEGIRLYRQSANPAVRAFRLEAHLERLRSSLCLMRLPEPRETDIAWIIDELVRRNNVESDSYVRVSVSPDNAGDIAAQGRACLSVTVTRMGRKRWLAEGKAMKVAVSCWQRSHDLAFPSAAKNISNYAGPRLALLEARDHGFDNVVLTTHDGFLCEGPTATLFLVKEGVVLSPPLSDGILPSITRATVFEICEALGIPALERRLSRTDAFLADEAFLCGTGVEFAPIERFDGYELRHAEQRPVTSRIIDAYFRLARGGVIGPVDGAEVEDPAKEANYD